jgi:hypothetical protein
MILKGVGIACSVSWQIDICYRSSGENFLNYSNIEKKTQDIQKIMTQYPRFVVY